MRPFHLLLFLLSLSLIMHPALLPAQEPGYPLYCCTDAGRFGPYENGTVNAGERCSAVDTARVRHVGTACHGPPSPPMLGPMETRGYADHCCTDVAVFGPFHDTTWQEGDQCAVEGEEGQRHDGVACYGVSGLLQRASVDGRLLAAARAAVGGCSPRAGAAALVIRDVPGGAMPVSPGPGRPPGSR